MKALITELTGARLDYALCMALEAWKVGHLFYPTMTLDPMFTGCRLAMNSDGREECLLIPRNPFRQDPQPFAPSNSYEMTGFFVDRELVSLNPLKDGTWQASSPWDREQQRFDFEQSHPITLEAPTMILAAVRLMALARVGSGIEMP
jgi:hypothetical protein